MAVINTYKASYPIENTFQQNTVFINATSMMNAISLLTTQYGNEPTFITKLHDNVLTEVTDETTVNVYVQSYYIDDENNEIEIPSCVVYPNTITNAKRGNTIYFVAPSYTFDSESEFEGEWILNKWIYDTTESNENPYIFTVPLDESITTIEIKAIYQKSEE